LGGKTVFEHLSRFVQQFKSCFDHMSLPSFKYMCYIWHCLAKLLHVLLNKFGKVWPKVQHNFKPLASGAAKDGPVLLQRHRQCASTGACASKLLVHLSMAHCIAWRGTAWRYIATHRIASHCIALHCTTSSCPALHSLQGIAQPVRPLHATRVGFF